jgi:YbbR domain-containing protein
VTERIRLGALRVTALVLAVLLWLWVTVERRGERPAEKIVEATVTYNPPPGMVILDPQDNVRVRLRGRERAIRRVNPFQIDVQVVVRADREGLVEVQLQPENVLMPDGVEVVSIEPNVLRLHVDQEVRRLLPVEVRLTGEPAAGAQLAGRPQIEPDEVLVTGPRKLVSALDTVRANPISLDGHAFDFQ